MMELPEVESQDPREVFTKICGKLRVVNASLRLPAIPPAHVPGSGAGLSIW